MNDACDVMQKRLEEFYLPALKDDRYFSQKVWKQEVSGNTGTVYELDLGRFTQAEFVTVFETAVATFYAKQPF